jgi:type I restriction enzyme S subunit
VSEKFAHGNIGPQITLLRCNNEVHYLFLKEIMTSDIIQKQVNSKNSGSAMNFFGIGETSKFKIPITSFEEQTKIASFLTAVDDKLQALKKKKELLEQYKKGVMQQLFSQALRFKNDDGTNYSDWEEKKLGDISVITTGSSNRVDSNLNGEYTFFDRSQDIRTSDRFLFDKEAVIVPGEGQEFVPKYFKGKFDLHQRTYAIFDFNSVIGKFLFYSISFNDKHLQSQAVGSTVKSLRLPMFQSMPIHCPCQDEQTKIANFLSAIDDKIAHCQSEVDGMERWKKGLLQQMFC